MQVMKGLHMVPKSQIIYDMSHVTFYQLCLTLSAELLSWRRRPSSVVHPSVRKLKFLRNCCMDPNFMGSYLAIHHISRPFFCCFCLFVFFSVFFFFKFSIFKFLRFFFVSVNMEPYGSKNFKMLLLLQFSSDLSQTLL